MVKRKKRRTWTEEAIIQEAQKYNGRKELEKSDQSLYVVIIKRGLGDRAFAHMVRQSRIWSSDEEIVQAASGYSSILELQKADPGLYQTIWRHKLQDRAFAHMVRNRRSWDDEELIKKAQTCKCPSELETEDRSLYYTVLRRGLRDRAFAHMIRVAGESKSENDLLQWVRECNLEPLHGFWLNGSVGRRQIDIYLPKKNIGIEYCGLHWHNELSPEPRTQKYHYDKMKLAEAKGIRLITIFEDEWLNRQAQVKNFLSSALGMSMTKISARKCKLVLVDSVSGRIFLDGHHIQGSTKQAQVFFGLVFENELVGVISGGRHPRQGHGGELVLDRLCFKSGVTIQGGASRLFRSLVDWAQAQGYTKIVSWSDNRISQGNVYEKMGFVLEEELPPDYSYVRVSGNTSSKRFSKQSLKKTPAERLTGKTELQLRTEQGYARIWDCGKKRWIYNISSGGDTSNG